MKLAVTPFHTNNINKLANKGADVFILGNDKYANRLVTSFSEFEIKQANEIIKSLNKEIIISMNLIIHNSDITDILEFLDIIKELNVDGIIFGDLGLYNIAKKKQLEHLLIYNPETLNTNFYDKTFWTRKRIKGIIISKEITLHDINEIGIDRNIDIGLVGHGHLNMFHSRRPLISNFFKFNNEESKDYVKNRNLRLIEELRDEAYPVFQDEHGTHIFREKPMESYNEINELSKSLDLFIIDGIFKDMDYLLETTKNYSDILKGNSQEIAKEISNKYKENHDSGFLYKKTVYDKY
ncbi:Peptidase family U32 [Candidatus Izimaplasma bacterium HR1]|jgi:putative protease|uniref:peptidase U32 family protein n=1 Tax=Candidatus Izimoplasma sp. HR1 TaxID=1541959 RepID=UPI0004F715F0|nr:Peptidase family U32 [Candidatus Izimaplasma bacterium HR1]